MRSAVRTKWLEREWRPWFAWRPIRVQAGRMHTWVWLETVDRCWRQHGFYDPTYTYKYRLRATNK